VVEILAKDPKLASMPLADGTSELPLNRAALRAHDLGCAQTIIEVLKLHQPQQDETAVVFLPRTVSEVSESDVIFLAKVVKFHQQQYGTDSVNTKPSRDSVSTDDTSYGIDRWESLGSDNSWQNPSDAGSEFGVSFRNEKLEEVYQAGVHLVHKVRVAGLCLGRSLGRFCEVL
jgi:hypothetical protein